MFLVTQLIGIWITSSYADGLRLPYGMEPPQEIQQEFSPIYFIISLLIAITLFFALTKLRAEKVIRVWFFIVTTLALGLALNAIISSPWISITDFDYSNQIPFIALLLAFPLAYFKIYKRNLTIHNATELLIYPGIAAVFIPLLNVLGIIIILLLISLYDMWAVWQSKLMQKMAEYQINNLKFFTGFFIPYADKKTKAKIKLLKEKYKNKSEKTMEKAFKKSKIKVHLAILGGGDIIFPIITAGIFYKTYQTLLPSFIIAISATLALAFLFVLARKGKFYPAMPFITIGIYLGMIVNWLVF